jgi:CRISPR-associated protein Cas2
MLSRINKYKVMWLFVHFDLPTETKEDRRNYAVFRKKLKQDGFNMLQYSMYARHCASRENSMVHKRRIERDLPPYGKIIIFELTDAQFGMMEFYTGKKAALKPNQPVQLELF